MWLLQIFPPRDESDVFENVILANDVNTGGKLFDVAAGTFLEM